MSFRDALLSLLLATRPYVNVANVYVSCVRIRNMARVPWVEIVKSAARSRWKARTWSSVSAPFLALQAVAQAETGITRTGLHPGS